MVPLELIVVLGFFFIFFTVGAVRGVLAKVQAKPFVAERVAGTVK